MSWEFVIKCQFTAGNTIEKVAEWVLTTGYDFFLFNGDVYYLAILEESFRCFKTEIHYEDLY